MRVMCRYIFLFLFLFLFIVVAPSLASEQLYDGNGSVEISSANDQFFTQHELSQIFDHLEGIRNSSYKNSKRLLSIRDLLTAIVLLQIVFLFFKFKEYKIRKSATFVSQIAAPGNDKKQKEEGGQEAGVLDKKEILTGKNLIRIIAIQFAIVLTLFIGVYTYSILF